MFLYVFLFVCLLSVSHYINRTKSSFLTSIGSIDSSGYPLSPYGPTAIRLSWPSTPRSISTPSEKTKTSSIAKKYQKNISRDGGLFDDLCRVGQIVPGVQQYQL